jgi:hypothetical protein
LDQGRELAVACRRRQVSVCCALSVFFSEKKIRKTWVPTARDLTLEFSMGDKLLTPIISDKARGSI